MELTRWNREWEIFHDDEFVMRSSIDLISARTKISLLLLVTRASPTNQCDVQGEIVQIADESQVG